MTKFMFAILRSHSCEPSHMKKIKIKKIKKNKKIADLIYGK
jgi:hypothetical protein